jgi:hypothetical protein
MRRLVPTTVAAAALTLPLAVPAGAGARTEWVCDPPGANTPPVTFVSAADAAFHGIDQANKKAGKVFGEQFGEQCDVVSR